MPYNSYFEGKPDWEELFIIILQLTGLEKFTTDKKIVFLAFHAAGKACPAVAVNMRNDFLRFFWTDRITDSIYYANMAAIMTSRIDQAPFTRGREYVINPSDGARRISQKDAWPDVCDEEWQQFVAAAKILREKLESFEGLTAQQALAQEYPPEETD